jgi:serine/threonine-protein kinase
MNIPHKEYWLAPERRQQTFAFVQRRSAWLAGLLIAFFAGLHFFIVAANSQAPVRLPPSFVYWMGGCVLAATIGWMAAFIGHFSRKPL